MLKQLELLLQFEEQAQARAFEFGYGPPRILAIAAGNYFGGGTCFFEMFISSFLLVNQKKKRKGKKKQPKVEKKLNYMYVDQEIQDGVHKYMHTLHSNEKKIIEEEEEEKKEEEPDFDTLFPLSSTVTPTVELFSKEDGKKFRVSEKLLMKESKRLKDIIEKEKEKKKAELKENERTSIGIGMNTCADTIQAMLSILFCADSDLTVMKTRLLDKVSLVFLHDIFVLSQSCQLTKVEKFCYNHYITVLELLEMDMKNDITHEKDPEHVRDLLFIWSISKCHKNHAFHKHGGEECHEHVNEEFHKGMSTVYKKASSILIEFLTRVKIGIEIWHICHGSSSILDGVP